MASRSRLSQRLSEVNKYSNWVEGQLSKRDAALQEAQDYLHKFQRELLSLQNLADSTAAAVLYGVDRSNAAAQVTQLMARLKTSLAALDAHQAEFRAHVVQDVPVAWYGVAQEVRMMGEFDAWAEGVELSPEDISQDNVYTRFEATLKLVPGKYQVKLQVDGEWRLAGEWPTITLPDGSENNLIIVE